MTVGEFFKQGQTFTMSDDAKQRVLSAIHKDQHVHQAPDRRSRRWVGSSVASVAAILVFASVISLVQHHRVSQPVASKHPPASKTLTPTITTRWDGAIYYTYSGTDLVPAVRKLGDFPVKLPNFPSAIPATDAQFFVYPEDKNKSYPMPSILFQRAEFDAGTNNETIVVQEHPVVSGVQSPFDTFVGPGEPVTDGKPQSVNVDGVVVRVGWPLSNEAHCYQFIQNNTIYFVKINWLNNNGPTSSKDADGWDVVRSLITAKAL